MSLRRPLAVFAILVLSAIAACSGDDDTAAPSPATGAADELTGLLGIEAGVCDGDTVTGSWFRMIQPNGTVDDGPFVDNPDTTCADTALTIVSPGTDGGLRLGGYQAEPDPAFLDDGASTAGAIITPQGFFAVPFGMSTNPTDPQTGADVPAPSATVADDTLTADLRAVSVSWNGQQFNQGAPSPSGEGAMATGTFDAETGAYSLEWVAPIVGGPFNSFTGVWHFEGTFEAS